MWLPGGFAVLKGAGEESQARGGAQRHKLDCQGLHVDIGCTIHAAGVDATCACVHGGKFPAVLVVVLGGQMGLLLGKMKEAWKWCRDCRLAVLFTVLGVAAETDSCVCFGLQATWDVGVDIGNQAKVLLDCG